MPAVLDNLRFQAGFLAAAAKLGFAMYMAYPAGVIMVFFSYPIIIMMYRYIYDAAYEGDELIAGYAKVTIITYVTISWILNTIYMTPTGRTLGGNVRSGQVAMDLIKPVNLMSIYFGQSIGRTGFRLLFACIPLLILFGLFGGIAAPEMRNIAPLAVCIACGYLINFHIDYIIGLAAFYFEYNNGMRWAARMILNIAGGMVIPLDYFPESLRWMFSALPNQFMFFQPMQIYLGRVGQSEAWLLATKAVLWVVGLFIAAQLAQRAGMRRLAISGG